MTNQSRLRTDPESVARLFAYQRAALREIRSAAAHMTEGRHAKAYDTLQEAREIIASVMDMTGVDPCQS